MASLFDSWSPTANRLGVEVRGPLRITLPDGTQLQAGLHVPRFGAEKGTLVFSDTSLLHHYEELLSMGYSYSIFGTPCEGDDISDADMVDILKDWGWCGPADERPNWIS